MQFPYLSVDELKQGGLSGTVGPHQRQSGVQVQSKLQILVDKWGVVAVPETHVLKKTMVRRDVVR